MNWSVYDFVVEIQATLTLVGPYKVICVSIYGRNADATHWVGLP